MFRGEVAVCLVPGRSIYDQTRRPVDGANRVWEEESVWSGEENGWEGRGAVQHQVRGGGCKEGGGMLK